MIIQLYNVLIIRTTPFISGQCYSLAESTMNLKQNLINSPTNAINQKNNTIHWFTNDAGVGIGMLVGPSEGWVGEWERFLCIGLKISKISILCFQKMLVSYSRISRSDKTDLKDLWHASFPKVVSVIMRFPNIFSISTCMDMCWVICIQCQE